MSPLRLSEIQFFCHADLLLRRAERHLRDGRLDRTTGDAFEALRALADTPAFEALLRRDSAFADRIGCATAAWRDLAPEGFTVSLLCDCPCAHCRLTPSDRP